MTSLQMFSTTPQSCKQLTRTTCGKFQLENLTAPVTCETVHDCVVYKIGHFQQCDSRSVVHFARNIREKRDVPDETFALMELLVGDGAIVVATPYHTTLLVPPFSEHNVFAWRAGDAIFLFDSIQSFRKFVSASRMSLEFDLDYLTQFLASDRLSNKKTAFRGLEEIEHSCSMTILGTDIDSPVVLNHLPKLLCQPSNVPQSQGEATERVRTLMAEAIRAKACAETVGIAVSGGFDSSLIALLCGREFPGSAPSLYHVYSSRVPTLNEVDYFNDVRERLDHRVKWLDTEDTRDFDLDFPHMVPGFRPPMVAGWYERNWMLYNEARADGVEVLLNGDGGDQLMLCLDDMSLLKDFREEGFSFARSAVSEALLRQTTVWRVLGNWSSGKSDANMLRWICHDFDNVQSVLPFLKMKNLFPIATSATVEELATLSVSRRFQACTLNDAKYNNVAASIGILERKPFLYWPLVRFCISCPRSLMFTGGRERGLFRSAFSDILPRSIANRVGKSGDVDVPNLFNYAAIKNSVVSSETVSDIIDVEAVASIDPRNLTEETAGFLMRCATVISFLKQSS